MKLAKMAKWICLIRDKTTIIFGRDWEALMDFLLKNGGGGIVLQFLDLLIEKG